MPDPKQTLGPDSAPNAEGKKDAEGAAATSSGAAPADASKQAEEIALRRISAITGRDYPSLEEAEKHLKNLNHMVGDNAVASNRKDAEFAGRVLDSVMREQGLSTRDEARSYLEKLMPEDKIENAPAAPAKPVLDEATLSRLRAGERAEFLLDNPEAREYLPKVEEYSKASGKTLKESFEFLYGDVVKARKAEADEEARKAEKIGATATASQSTETAKVPDAEAKSISDFKEGKDPNGLRNALKLRSMRMLGVKPKEDQ